MNINLTPKHLWWNACPNLYVHENVSHLNEILTSKARKKRNERMKCSASKGLNICVFVHIFWFRYFVFACVCKFFERCFYSIVNVILLFYWCCFVLIMFVVLLHPNSCFFRSLHIFLLLFITVKLFFVCLSCL